MAYKDKKMAMAKVNEYQKEKYDRITVMASKGKKKDWKAAADLKNMSLSSFVMDCVEKELDRMREKFK